MGRIGIEIGMSCDCIPNQCFPSISDSIPENTVHFAFTHMTRPVGNVWPTELNKCVEIID